MSHDLAAAVGAAAFWLFVAIIVVANVWKSVSRNREAQRTIRQAIDKGQTLDPQTLDRLLRSDQPPPPPPEAARGMFLFGAIMMFALALGLAAIGWFTSRDNPGALYPGLGAGALVGLLGMGLLVVMLFIPKRKGP